MRSIAPKTPIIGIVTKLDKASKDQVGAQLLALHELLTQEDPNAVVIPVSSKEGVQLDELVQVIVDHLPEGPKFYPDDHITDEGQEKRIEELIREAALSGLKAELPHSVAVQVDEMLPSRTREGSISSTCTATECGSSAFKPDRAASRMSSSMRFSWPSSVM